MKKPGSFISFLLALALLLYAPISMAAGGEKDFEFEKDIAAPTGLSVQDDNVSGDGFAYNPDGAINDIVDLYAAAAEQDEPADIPPAERGIPQDDIYLTALISSGAIIGFNLDVPAALMAVITGSGISADDFEIQGVTSEVTSLVINGNTITLNVNPIDPLGQYSIVYTGGLSINLSFTYSNIDESIVSNEATFDLLAVNTINRERIATVVIDMGREIDGASLALDTFSVYAQPRLVSNNSIVTANAGYRTISKVYVNSSSEQTANPPASGNYIIIEMVYWGENTSLTASDSVAWKLEYIVEQLKDLEAAGGTVEPGDIDYIQGRTINELIERFEYGQLTANGITNYRLFRPDDVSIPQPLIVFLHGGGQGTDNECHMRFQNNLYFAMPEQQAQYPSYVLMPATSSWGNTHFDNIKGLVDDMIADGLVDPTRVYITGSSMGGGGTWNFIQRYPDYFAAAAPITPASGITSVANARAVADIPIWTFVTRRDNLCYNTTMSNHRNYSQYLNNYTLTYDNETYIPNVFPGVDWDMSAYPHSAWIMAYNYHNNVAKGGRLIDWMFAQEKNTDTSFDLLALNTINRERIATVVIDLRKEADGSSIDMETFTVASHATNHITGAAIPASSGNRTISNIYVNTAPEQTANPPATGQYIIIEMVYWGTDLSLTASDNVAYKIDYTVTQNKPFTTDAGTVNPNDITFRQRLIKNELLGKFLKGSIRAPGSANVTAYSLFESEYPQNWNSTPTRLPLVILLHGGGQGADNETQLRFQNNLYYCYPEQQAQYPSYVLIPASSGWSASDFDNLNYLIGKMIADGRVDSTRIYVTGASMGGSGTWNFIQRYPDLFAAAVPMAAGATATVSGFQAIADLPVWNFFTVGDFTQSSVMSTHNNYAVPYLNNYKFTIFYENFIPRANNNIPADWDMSAYPHAEWLMAYNVHSDISMGGRVIDWMFAQKKSTSPNDTNFDLLTINWIARERVTAAVIDMREDVVGSSLDLDTFNVHVKQSDPRNGSVAVDADRVVSKIYVNSVPETTDTPPAVGQYVIIELVYWPSTTEGATNASDSIAYLLNYTIAQNKAFQTSDGPINTGDLNYKQRQIKNELIDQLMRGYIKAPTSASPTRYSLFAPKNQVLAPTQRYPLVILLHGGGQGTDNEAHLRFQNNLYFAWPETQEDYPSYVLLPTNCSSSDAFDNIKVLIDKLIAAGRVDPDRIYITGSSAGGGGTWSFVQRYPDLFAAAAPICAAGGISSVANAEALEDLPIWAFVTIGDSLYTGNMNTYNTYNSYIFDYKLTVFEENYIPWLDWLQVPHAAWLMAYNNHTDPVRGTMIEWMFGQKKMSADDRLQKELDELKALIDSGDYTYDSTALAQDVVDEVETAILAGGLTPEDINALRWKIKAAKAQLVLKSDSNTAYFTITGTETVASGAGATANYTISAENMPMTNGIELVFEVDGSFLSSKEFNALGGFSAIGVGNYGTPEVFWQANGNIWTGKVTLVNLAGASGDVDVFNMEFYVIEGALGITDVKLISVAVSSSAIGTVSSYIYNDTATTLCVQWYSKYDFNKDGVIDLNDITFAMQYLLVNNTDANWDEAKVCDVEEDGVIDSKDLILILANYTIPYYG